MMARTRSARDGAAQTVDLRTIHDVVEQIVDVAAPRQVILFGSYATGHATLDSDVDLLVITKKPTGPDASLRLRRRL
ncbi:MAG: nucleotidyltransferase family protein, partial [Planctomycetota bacterium]